MHPKQISIADYSYVLPDERIAKFPLEVRDRSKLLVVQGSQIQEDVFSGLVNHLPQGALMVVNNTKVIQARLDFWKETGAHIEIFCLEPHGYTDYAIAFGQRGQVDWNCMVGNLKKWKGQVLSHSFVVQGVEYILKAEYIAAGSKSHHIRFVWSEDLCFSEVLEHCGHLPIPPYLHRETEPSDLLNYQTVYSKIKGSVAAPTAGLHFTDAVLQSLASHGITWEELTLHVGAGTFQPVKTTLIGDHQMHTEMIQVSPSTIASLAQHKQPIIAVGTTSVRTLESLYWMGCKVILNPQLPLENLSISQWYPYEYTATLPTRKEALEALVFYLEQQQCSTLFSSTEIIIAPGYQFHVVEGIVTNFHQPQSTLLLLIAAFLKINFKEVYQYAMDHDFRFLSYGDSSLLL